MSGHRQAALALHPLSAHDRDLILAELPPADQAQLREHLAELTELGFDLPLLKAVPVRPLAGAPLLDASPHGRLRSASADAVAALLEGEPAALVAQLLRSEPWPWTEAFLAKLTPSRRLVVQQALAAETLAAPARCTFVIEALGTCLQQAAPVTPSKASAPAPGFWTKVTAWTR